MTIAYRSAFEQWDTQAAVRRFSFTFSLAGEVAGTWFPLEDCPFASHPAVRAEGRGPCVQAAALLAYLDFTITLESECIGPTCRDLALGRIGAGYGGDVIRDALRIGCDEAFHALLCQELADHVSRASEVPRPRIAEHHYLRRVRELRARTAGPTPEQFAFCAAVVAETVITKSLSHDWLNEALRPEVRSFLREHYRDEVRHTVFFTECLRLAWPQWPARVRTAMAAVWPDLLQAFTGVDLDTAAAAVTAAGFSPAEARRIAEESCAGGAESLRRRACYTSAVAALRQAGTGEPTETPVDVLVEPSR